MTDAWNGVPQNPERDGWHWIHCIDLDFSAPTAWSRLRQSWMTSNQTLTPKEVCLEGEYLGPCLSPAEVAAAIRDAEVKGMMRAAEIAEKETAGGLSPYNLRHAVIAIRAAAAAHRGGAGDE